MTFVEFFVWIAVILWAFDVDDATLAGLAALVQPVPAAFLAPAIASVGDRVQGARRWSSRMR